MKEEIFATMLCPNCNQGRDRIEETSNGFSVCGLCKGKGSVEVVNEGYSTVKTSFFEKRSGMDVTRLRGLERKTTDEDVKQFNKLAEYGKTKFLGFRPYYKTLVQNEVNHINH